MKDKYIVCFEDDPAIAQGLKLVLKASFTDYSLLMNQGGKNCINEVLEETDGIKNIEVLLTDGMLLEGNKGWDVAKEFKARGFKGPAIYIGSTELPKGKEKLYHEISNTKDGASLAKIIQEYLPKTD